MFKMNKDFVAGAAVGFLAGYVVKSIASGDTESLNKTMKSVMKVGTKAFQNVKATVAQAAENLSDIYAEIQAESETTRSSEVVVEGEA